MSSTPAPLPPQSEGEHIARVTQERQIASAVMPVSTTVAATVAKECLACGHTMARYQNDRTVLSAGWMTKITSALLSAGSVLGAADKIDPTGDPPEGFTKKVEFAADGRLVVTFEQVLSASRVEPQTQGVRS